MKVVINGRFGGFGLSQAGHDELARRHNRFVALDLDGAFYAQDIPRTDPDLVQMVEDNPGLYGGSGSGLYVVEVPDDVEWYIHDYDGREHVAEKHRTWQ